MSISPTTTSATHDAASIASEATRQSADAAAQAAFKAGGTSAALQAALTANAVADLRRIASAVVNNIDPAVWRQNLWELTGSWV